MAASSSYWCYRCSRFIRILNRNAVVCPDCDTGFIEEIAPSPVPGRSSRRRFPRSTIHLFGNRLTTLNPFQFRRGRHSGSDLQQFNPVIVFRGPSDGGGEAGSFELYYDDGTGSGLRPLPTTMSNFLMRSGFDRLLDQLAQMDINAVARRNPSPASKEAVESMPTVEIAASHVDMDLHCAVCKEPFKQASHALEMPCNHIYHSDCILPWLSLRNSCPVCRHELPIDEQQNSPEQEASSEEQPSANAEEDPVGLTIWRLPSGGYAVGRLSGGRGSGERELPVVYTEMDGSANLGGLPRRISWSSRSNRIRGRGRIGQAVSSFFSLFGRLHLSSGSSQRNRSTESDFSRASLSSGLSRVMGLDNENGASR